MTVDGNRRLGIDFDGVIHDYNRGWCNGAIYGEAIDGAIRALFDLKGAGYEIFILTSRVSKEHAQEEREQQELWIRQWLVNKFVITKLDHAGRTINRGMAKMIVDKIDITADKKPAIAYIDDRGVRFTNWWDLRKMWV